MTYNFDNDGSCVESCSGHLGKFPDCITEALWSASLDWQPEQTGDVDGFGTWACILDFPRGQYLSVSPGYYEALENDGPTIWIPAGSYVLATDDRGAVWIEALTADDARARFDAIDTAYSAWLHSDDGQEF